MANQSPLGPEPPRPQAGECQRAYEVIVSARRSASSFLAIYDERAGVQPSDEDEDLLRAMLLFASAGLDAMVKQLIRDALPALISHNEGAREQLRVFISRRLRDEGQRYELLSSLLVGREPEAPERLLVEELCSGSLQSSEALLRVGAYFDIATSELTEDRPGLDRVFTIRNQVAHEMDCDFGQADRHRRRRTYEAMVAEVAALFGFAARFLDATDRRFFRTEASE